MGIVKGFLMGHKTVKLLMGHSFFLCGFFGNLKSEDAGDRGMFTFTFIYTFLTPSQNVPDFFYPPPERVKKIQNESKKH